MAHNLYIPSWEKYTPDHSITCGEVVDQYDLPALVRIASALRLALSRREYGADDVWSGIVAQHQDLVHLFTAGRFEQANALLARLFSTPLTYGFEQHRETHDAVLHDIGQQSHVRLFAFDKLLSIAEWLRLIPVQTVEQGDFVPVLKRSPDELLNSIEAKLGIKISAPSFSGGLFGLKTAHGIFSERTMSGLYVALRIREFAEKAGRSLRVCEIGGGVGYVAYFCRQFGITDYTLVDLPTVGAVQAHFLMRNLSSESVALTGEPVSPEKLKIISGETFLTEGHAPFDLLVNVDSLPEMDGRIMRRYIGSGVFRKLFSINQEAMSVRAGQAHQERVGDVIDELGGFTLLQRHPCWLRPGYVEELYSATPSRNDPLWQD
jgi:hypothetical protein